MGISFVRRAFAACLAGLTLAALFAVPSAAQRLRSPASSLVLATPTVTCGSSPRVNLTWTDSAPSPTGTYRVMSNSSTKQNAWSAGPYLGDVRTTSVSAANGSTWRFAIHAVTSVTRDSNVVSITVNCAPVDGTAPGVPTITSAVPESCSAVDIAWAPTTDTGGSGLAGYNVWRDSSFIMRVSAATTSVADSGLAATTAYSYQVSAIDTAGNQSARSNAMGTATPSCTNQAPTAHAGSDQSVSTLVAVSFNGSASSDSDGSIASYSWNFGDGASGNGVAPSHAYAASGTYTVTLTVTDNQGATASDALVVTVSNRAPIANAGADQTATAGVAVTLSGAGSSDPDGSITAYSWNFGDGATGSGVSTSHAYAASGTFVATLTVTDNKGATGSDTAVVNVGAVPNQPPVANAGADQSAQTLTNVNFSGASSSDPDGSISSYAWNFGDGTTGSGISAAHSYASSGSYTVTLTVADNKGATATDTATVTITNRPPVANAGADQSAQTLVSLSFSGAASSDPDGTISSYAWNFGDGATATGASWSHTYSTSGTYTVTLTVTDNKGASATDTATATITNRLPVANAGADQTTQTLTSVSFNGSLSSDPDGTISSYAWNFGDGTSGAGAAAAHTYASAGSYTATLTVTDNKGAMATDTATVTVTNRPPVASAGADQSAQTLVSVSFNGAASSDPDGSIASYAWNFGDGASGVGVTAAHTYASSGSYTVTMTVTDNKGATASDTATATITNRPPTANAGADQSATVGAAVSFNGSTSSDLDGTISSYSWSFGDGASGSGVTAAHTYATAATYTATLTVTDNKGGTAADTAVITVNAGGGTGNQAPIAAAGSDVTLQTAMVMSFNGAGSRDPDGTIASYAWNFGDGATATGITAQHGFAHAGVYTVRLTVTDNQGATGTDTAILTITNRAPSPTAGADQTVTVGVAANFNGSGSFDPDGTITSWAWTFGDGTTGSGPTPAHAYTSVGTFTVIMTITDNNGATATDSVVMTVVAANTPTWAKDWGSTLSDGANAVATDAAGNMYVAGQFRGTMVVGTTTLVDGGTPADDYLVKYAPDGSVVWVRSIGSAAADENVKGLAIDAAGNLDLVGSFGSGTTNLGGSDLVPVGGGDMFVAQYSSATGAHQWSKRFGGQYASDDARGVAVDSLGNVYITGMYSGTVNFGGANLTVPFTSDLDVFVLKLTSGGAHVWSKNFPNDANDIGYAIAVDGPGNVVIAGSLFNSINFSGQALGGPGTLSSPNSLTDAFVAKFTTNGAYMWSFRAGTTTGNEQALDVTMDTAGNAILSMFSASTVDLGGGSLPAQGKSDVIIAKYATATGAHLWSRRYGGSGNDSASSLTTDAQNNVFVAGSFDSASLAFGTTTLIANGSLPSGFVAKLDSAGTLAWARQEGGLTNATANVNDLALSSGYPVVVGYSRGTNSYDGRLVTSVGDADAFMVRTAP